MREITRRKREISFYRSQLLPKGICKGGKEERAGLIICLAQRQRGGKRYSLNDKTWYDHIATAALTTRLATQTVLDHWRGLIAIKFIVLCLSSHHYYLRIGRAERAKWARFKKKSHWSQSSIESDCLLSLISSFFGQTQKLTHVVEKGRRKKKVFFCCFFFSHPLDQICSSHHAFGPTARKLIYSQRSTEKTWLIESVESLEQRIDQDRKSVV